MAEPTRGWLGRSLPRREDVRFLTGRGQFVDDVVLPGLLHAAVLRSPYPHARVKSVDVSPALALPGVSAAITGADVRELIVPEHGRTTPAGGEWYFIATDRVRFVGEPVALVAAEDRYLAEDALDAIDVEYEEMPPVMDAERASDPDQPVLHPEAPGGNEVLHYHRDFGDVEAAFAEADVVVSESFSFHRYTSTPLEGQAVIASWDTHGGQVTIWANVGNLTRLMALSRCLKLDESRIRLIVPDVGGHFGVKAWVHHPAILAAILSRKAGRPVKWVEDRLEHLAASVHGTGRSGTVRLAARQDGTILGFELATVDDQGAYVCPPEPYGPQLTLASGVIGAYRIENVRLDMRCVLTNRCPVASNRGYGRLQHYFLLERAVERLAQKLQLDPIDLRRRNAIPASAFPYQTPSHSLYDSGDPAALLDKLKETLDYNGALREREQARAAGRYLGIGTALMVDPSGSNISGQAWSYGLPAKSGLVADVATVQVRPDGRFAVATPTLAQGQGHETTLAQIVADQFGVHPSSVDVDVRFDMATSAYSPVSGTYSSRFSAAAACAVHGAAAKLRDQLALLAAKVLEASPDDIVFEEAAVSVLGAPSRSVPLERLVRTAYLAPDSFGMGPDLGLQATYRWNWPSANAPDERGGLYNMCATYGMVAHGAVVEVDAETGQLRIVRYAAVGDCGRILNPRIVEGQTHGALAHGLGGALYEKIEYDENGQLLTSTFMDYLVPRFGDMPPLTVDHLEFPTPFGPLGAKGVAEGACLPPPAVLANAVEDALAPLGVKLRDAHLSPGAVREAIKDARQHVARS